MKKFVVRIVSAFIPVRAWRKSVREKLLTPKWKAQDYAIANGMRFAVTPHEFWHPFNEKIWEPETLQFYSKYTHPMKEVIDIGGWIGPTMLLAYAYNALKITVVEADPANYQILKTNCRKNYLEDKVELHCTCISDTTDEILNFGGQNTMIPQDSSTNCIGGQRVKVRTTSCLDFLQSKDLRKVNIIKIDIEGAERFIADGLEYISRFPDITVLLSIHTPFWPDKRETARVLMAELEKFQVFSEKETAMDKAELEAMLTAEVPCSWPDKTGKFFTLLLKTVAK